MTDELNRQSFITNPVSSCYVNLEPVRCDCAVGVWLGTAVWAVCVGPA